MLWHPHRIQGASMAAAAAAAAVAIIFVVFVSNIVATSSLLQQQQRQRQTFLRSSCDAMDIACGENHTNLGCSSLSFSDDSAAAATATTTTTTTTGARRSTGGATVFADSAKHTATLVLAASLAVTAPMPATAQMEATMLPNHSPFATMVSSTSTSTSSSSSSSVVLATQQPQAQTTKATATTITISDAAPYTGQLVDTSNANVVILDSGVSYNDLREGASGGDVASEGKRVNIQWVLKRSNGYSIDSSAQNDGVPFIFVVGTINDKHGTNANADTAIPGLDEGIRGMKVGGIRRIVIPPSLAYVGGVGDNAPGPVPPGFGPRQRIKRVMENRIDVPDESFLLDVKLTRVQ